MKRLADLSPDRLNQHFREEASGAFSSVCSQENIHLGNHDGICNGAMTQLDWDVDLGIDKRLPGIGRE